MSVLRQANLLGQSRIDVPHVRALESSICADFDLLAGSILAGAHPYVVTGFAVTTTTTGIDASRITISTAAGVLLHPLASESGTIFSVPANRTPEVLTSTNPRVQGSFTANAINFIGVDLRRTADSTTSDLVQFLDPDTNGETPKIVPLARTLDYIIIISTQDFGSTPGVAPVAKVTTDANNNVTFVEDARNMMWRLGSGGTVTNAFAGYNWPGGRSEVGDNTDFNAADKVIGSLREWAQAIMSRVWEIGGGQHWYSPTADRNIRLARSGSTFGNGDWFAWDGTNLLWQGLQFVFDNSTGYYNQIKDQVTTQAGLTNLSDGDCVYVDVDRTRNLSGVNALVPVKVQLTNLGASTVPGARFVLAWRIGGSIFTRDAQFPVNASFVTATPTSMGIVKLHQASLTPLSPSALTDGDINTATGVLGLNANKQSTIAATTGDGLTITTAAGNGNGIVVAGQGSGAGVRATAGVTGAGGVFTGGSTGGTGLIAVGGSGSVGIQVTAGSGAGNDGLQATGGSGGAAIVAQAASAADAAIQTRTGFVQIALVPVASAPTTSPAGAVRFFVTDNNLAAGSGKRWQFGIVFPDSTTVIVAESEPV